MATLELSGVVIGFVILGWTLRQLDLLAARLNFFFFFFFFFFFKKKLVLIIQPNGSMAVELCGGSEYHFSSRLELGVGAMVVPHGPPVECAVRELRAN